MKYTDRIVPDVMHANCGHGVHRRLEDCVRLNFISAGQGDDEKRQPDAFGKQIRRLIIGDVLAVYRNEVGYVGIAKVISDPMPINDAFLGGVKVTPDIFSPESDMFDNADNVNKEWLVEIKWLTRNVYLENKKRGGAGFSLFPTMLVTCSLKNQLNLKRVLQEAFHVDFEHLLNNDFEIAESSDERFFPEGREYYRLHKFKERSSELVKLAKERHAMRDEMMQCQVCNFSFTKAYGKIGRGFIEVHHLFPISQLTKETPTRIEDLALVCSNCHRMLHRKRPWITVENLKSLLED